MDEGIWAVWFDLDKKVRASHLKWLHETYLPEVSARPGIAWAAHYELHPEIESKQRERLTHTDEPMGQALQHLVLVGATQPGIFFRADSPLEEKNQSRETRSRMAERLEQRWLIAREQSRINGADYGDLMPGGVTSACIQLGTFNMTSAEAEMGLGKFYEQLRFPEFAKSPGARRMRKLVGVAGWAKHAVLYEFTSNEERTGSPVYQSIRQTMAQAGDHPLQWGEKVIGQTIHAAGSPVIGFRKWPKV